MVVSPALGTWLPLLLRGQPLTSFPLLLFLLCHLTPVHLSGHHYMSLPWGNPPTETVETQLEPPVLPVAFPSQHLPQAVTCGVIRYL